MRKLLLHLPQSGPVVLCSHSHCRLPSRTEHRLACRLHLHLGGHGEGRGISEWVGGCSGSLKGLESVSGGREGALEATHPTCQDSLLGQAPPTHHSESFQKEVLLAPASHGVVPDAVFLVIQLWITVVVNR